MKWTHDNSTTNNLLPTSSLISSLVLETTVLVQNTMGTNYKQTKSDVLVLSVRVIFKRFYQYYKTGIIIYPSSIRLYFYLPPSEQLFMNRSAICT